MARILIIDDDSDLSAMCQIVLEGVGHETEALPDGAFVFEAIARRRPDLIILDWVIPGHSGDEVLHELRNSNASDIPVLMISALAGAAAAAKLIGPDDFLVKPFDADDLERAVTHLLDARQLQRLSREAAQRRVELRGHGHAPRR